MVGNRHLAEIIAIKKSFLGKNFVLFPDHLNKLISYFLLSLKKQKKMT